MPLFGEKRFKKAEREEIAKRLIECPPLSFLTSTSNGRTKDSSMDFPCLIALANSIFGFNGWSHSVANQTIDFVELDGDKYEVGASAVVKVLLKDGTFHEDMGYGFSKGLKCRGSSISKARRAAAWDGLKNALCCFGKGLSCMSATGKITDFLQPSQGPTKRGNVTLSGVKRKLVPEFDSIPQHSPVNARSVLLPPFTSSPTSKTSLGCFYNAQHTPSTEDSFVSPPAVLDEGNSVPCTPSSQPKFESTPTTAAEKDPEKLKRKLRQIDLEIKARELARQNLQSQLENVASLPDDQASSSGLKNELYSD